MHQDATARLWNVDTRDKRLVHALEHESDVSAASFSPDGRRLLTVSGTAVRLWDWKTGAPLVDLNHAKAVTAASFALDGRLVVSSSRDGTARVWDVETGRERFVAKHQDEVKHALLVASGKLLANTVIARAQIVERVERNRGDRRSPLRACGLFREP